ncbi:hypothetical protein JG687_00018512 [Phytophthora cactorum]|uniref:Uncharacterized protein n=1 Tax=Phytophthora cactorum TaxID=29920 RepID=A0A8T1TKS4_9STRA|nr:hypothetical protein JG687_00018512 [Phytophthora cactorum]
MICQSDLTIRVTSTAERARHAYAVCLAVGIDIHFLGQIGSTPFVGQRAGQICDG